MSSQPSNSPIPLDPDEEIRRVMARKTRRSFLIGGAATAATIGAYEWLSNAKQVGQLQSPLRRAEQFNAAVSHVLFREQPLAPTYPISRSTELRLNADVGLDLHMIPNSWRLQLVGLAHPEKYKQYIEDVGLWNYRSSGDSHDATSQSEQPNPKIKPGENLHVSQAAPKLPSNSTRTPGILLSLDDLRALPFTQQVTQFKCIEGWSQITSFGGARFGDFLKAYPPQRTADGTLPRYVNMETYDGSFSSSLDIATLLHPQTLLCYEMNGRPLSPGHGAPLRMAMPLKYGYKQIKQVAKITYTDQRPIDFWETRGYDWYAGL